MTARRSLSDVDITAHKETAIFVPFCDELLQKVDRHSSPFYLRTRISTKELNMMTSATFPNLDTKRGGRISCSGVPESHVVAWDVFYEGLPRISPDAADMAN